MYRKPALMLAASLAALAPIQTPALPGDSDQEIVFDADRSELDRNRGVAIYRGNVRIVRGGIEIRGDELVLKFVEDELTEATIRGTPASFVQRHADGQPPTEAAANELVYDVVAAQVYLRGAVRITQAGNQVASDDVRYDIASERVVAGGETDSRVRVTIQPRRPAEEDPEPRR